MFYKKGKNRKKCPSKNEAFFQKFNKAKQRLEKKNYLFLKGAKEFYFVILPILQLFSFTHFALEQN